jgi:hypothetical protein
MSNPKTSSAPNKAKERQRLWRTAEYALVRGAAYAAGSGIVGLVVWWLTNRK